MEWTVKVKPRAAKQAEKLPGKVRDALLALILEIRTEGPYRSNWPNYGWLKQSSCYHCHLKKGKPTYVALWTVDKQQIAVEVIYVGTHEKAPY
jgi:mRNA-degrading endonuclease RelE of RelBE toxin-antitoxin system